MIMSVAVQSSESLHLSGNIVLYTGNSILHTGVASNMQGVPLLWLTTGRKTVVTSYSRIIGALR